MPAIKTLQTDLEQSCYEALDAGLIGSAIVDHMIRENSFQYRKTVFGNDLRKTANEVYTSISKLLSDGYSSV
jgi:hypothetical protein